MTHTTTTPALSPHDKPASSKAPVSLSIALKKYQEDSDLESLRRAYSDYVSHQKSMENSRAKMNLKTIFRGFGSFNIAPSNCYERYMALLGNKSDADAIRSDWEAVGEDLSYAFVKYTLKPGADDG